MWDLIVSVPDHCLSFYFAMFLCKIQLLKQGFMKYKPYYTYSMISKNIYAKIFFFQINCLYFLSFGRN